MQDFYQDRPSFKILQYKENLVGVEVGVESGRNAENILTHLDIKHLYLIDPWYTYNNFCGHGVMENDDVADLCYQATITRLKPFEDKVTIFKMKSDEAVDKIPDKVDFIYLDGNHRYEWITKDIALYWPKVKEGGFLMGHDYKTGEQGVMKAVMDAFGTEFEVGNWDWWIQKRSE